MTPSSVDWRERGGWPWLTRIKDQGGCGSCYTFGGTGVVEAMLRIEHCLWSPRSEGDAGDAISFYFGAKGKCEGGSPANVLKWIKRNGVADPGCWQSLNTEHVGTPTPDRLGRTGKIDDYHAVPASDYKEWLNANGPLAACFNCYPEFDDACKDNQVYVYSSPKHQKSDGHCILIVGYDDEMQAWLIRNSWGTGWGTDGYGWFGYGQGENGLEYFTAYGVVGTQTNPDPWSRRRLHNGNFFESGDGSRHRNFEVWAPGPGGIVHHFTQDGDTQAWALVETLPEISLPDGKKGYDCAAIPSTLDSTYFRNFELAYRTTDHELRHCFFDQLDGSWTSHKPFGSDIGGTAGFIQINVGAPGNFEIVVRDRKGKLQNWVRDNTANSGEWTLKHTFGSGVQHSGATLVQRWVRNDGAPNVTGDLWQTYWTLPAGLDVVCVNERKELQRWWRDDPNTSTWVQCETFARDVDSAPVMIRSQYGAVDETVPGNYELCVAVNGEIQHWVAKGNPEPTTSATWTLREKFRTSVPDQDVHRVLGLIESSYGFHFELVAELSSGQLQHFSRNASGWSAREVFGSMS
jgi:hypothetical protein